MHSTPGMSTWSISRTNMPSDKSAWRRNSPFSQHRSNHNPWLPTWTSHIIRNGRTRRIACLMVLDLTLCPTVNDIHQGIGCFNFVDPVKSVLVPCVSLVTARARVASQLPPSQLKLQASPKTNHISYFSPYFINRVSLHRHGFSIGDLASARFYSHSRVPQ
jgi:hypothetical protein